MNELACPSLPKLHQFLEGSLTPAEEQSVDTHISACNTCEQILCSVRPEGIDVVFSLPQNHPLESPKWIGRYRILQELGRGGMGIVYLALDEKLQRQVALKVISIQNSQNVAVKERFLREARASAGIASDYVVSIYEIDEVDGVTYIAMPLLQGSSLEDYLKQNLKLDLMEILRIGRDLALGLADTHSIGILHRDIKPSNIWIDSTNGRAKILDYGLAKPVSDYDDSFATAEGTILGTPAYMAPEQAAGGVVDGRADLFSLGCVLYRLCTNQHAFDRRTITATLLAVANESPPDIQSINPSISNELDRLIKKLLAKQPDNRPSNAKVVAETLRGLMASTTVPERNRKTKRIVAGLLFGLFAFAIAGIVVKITNKDGTTTTILVPEGAKVEVINDKAAGETQYSADRKAAEYALSIGGRIQINDSATQLSKIAELPSELFRLTKCYLGENQLVTDAGMAAFSGCQSLTTLSVSSTKVTSAGLKYFEGITSLEELWFTTTAISDTGLAYFKSCKNLSTLFIADTAVTDIGLKNLQFFPNLRYLQLPGPKITDIGLANLKYCQKLQGIYLDGIPISKQTAETISNLRLIVLCVSNTELTNDILKQFQNYSELVTLNLYQTNADNTCVNIFRKCKSLSYLNLEGTQITDECVDTITGFDRLTLLKVNNTKLSLIAIRKIAIKLPKCRIVHSSGTIIEPSAIGPDELAASSVLAWGGQVRLNHYGRIYVSVDHFPPPPYRLHSVKLNGKTDVTDTHLEVFKKCEHITDIELGSTQASDVGLQNFMFAKNIESLSLHKTKVTAAGLSKLKIQSSIRHIDIHGTEVNDDVCSWLKECTSLQYLALSYTSLTDKGFVQLTQFPKLRELLLNDTAITDIGLKAFQDCSELRDLFLSNTKITDKGLKPFLKCKELSFLEVIDTKISQTLLDEFQRLHPKLKITIKP